MWDTTSTTGTVEQHEVRSFFFFLLLQQNRSGAVFVHEISFFFHAEYLLLLSATYIIISLELRAEYTCLHHRQHPCTTHLYANTL